MKKTTAKKPDEYEEIRESNVAWLAALEIARERGDFERAAEAAKVLLSRGIKVIYGARKGAKNDTH